MLRKQFELFGTRRKLNENPSVPIKLMFGSEEVEPVFLIKYLGMQLDECLNFEDQISFIVNHVAGWELFARAVPS